VQKINGVLTLRQHHLRRRASNQNTEEEREIPEISHRKLTVEKGGDMLKKSRTRRSENNVVHVQEQVGNVLSSSKDK
jgi:hypothetical protein